MLGNIKEEGLTRGYIPFITKGKIKLLKNSQWLTLNPDFDQSWERHSTLPYRRNAFRITIKVPKSAKENLIKWLDLCKHEKFEETANVLNEYGDPENWYIFFGKVKTSWFREITEKEK